jgi:phage shock protein PspC (stress-responsive transcriptional regulator)
MAKALGWSGFRVRLIYVIVSIASAAFPGILVDLILWLVIPQEP